MNTHITSGVTAISQNILQDWSSTKKREDKVEDKDILI